MLSSLDTMRKETLASQQYLIVFTALIVWDYLSLLPAEYRHIYLAEWSFLKVCYLLNRYGSLVLVVICTTLRLTTISPETCGRIFWVQPFCFVYVVLITDAMLMNRVFILYERSRRVLIALSAMFVVEAVTLIAAASQVGYLRLPRPVAFSLHLEGCLAQGYRGNTFRGIIVFLSTAPLTVNSILLLLTFYQSWRVKKEYGVTLPLLQRINRGGLQYFAIITVFNVVNFYFYHQPNPCIRSFNIVANIVCSSLLSCRLALSLFDYRPPTPTIPDIAPSPMITAPLQPKVTFHDVRPRKLRRPRNSASKRNSAGIGSFPRAKVEVVDADAESDSDESGRTVELMR